MDNHMSGASRAVYRKVFGKLAQAGCGARERERERERGGRRWRRRRIAAAEGAHGFVTTRLPCRMKKLTAPGGICGCRVVAVSGRNTAPTGMEGIVFALAMCKEVSARYFPLALYGACPIG